MSGPEGILWLTRCRADRWEHSLRVLIGAVGCDPCGRAGALRYRPGKPVDPLGLSDLPRRYLCDLPRPATRGMAPAVGAKLHGGGVSLRAAASASDGFRRV